tara:strand:- start:86 stop:505 length:420 start_codon:yes stop_codon:yes gene_type:complete
MTDETAIWTAIDRANAAWTQGRPRDVGALYHADAVHIAPGIATRLQGRGPMVESYEVYDAAARTEHFEVVRRDLTVRGDTAIATYVFHVVYTIEGERYDEHGQEIMVLERAPDAELGWLAVWRHQVALPEAGTSLAGSA